MKPGNQCLVLVKAVDPTLVTVFITIVSVRHLPLQEVTEL